MGRGKGEREGGGGRGVKRREEVARGCKGERGGGGGGG